MGGILFHILRHAYDQAAESRRQTEEVIAATGRELASDQQQLEGQLHAWCRAESSGFVLLLDNDWAHSEIDGVSMAAVDPAALVGPGGAADAQGPYRGDGSRKLAGCFSVGVGRHTVSTRLDGSAAPVTLPFLVFPEECFVRRLDRSARTWVRVDASEEERLRERISTKALLLSDYFETVARARARAGVARSPSHLQYVTDEVSKLIACIDAGEPPARLAGVASSLAAGFVGVPLETTDGLTRMIGRVSWERAAAGRYSEAWLVASLGLAILPEEPTLLALLGVLTAQTGKVLEAIQALDLALARERYLDPFWAQQARATRATLG